MSEFEFISILVSIVIGLSMTHVLRGSVSQILISRRLESRIVYSTFFLLVLVLNWWVIWGWRDHVGWNFGEFLVLIAWSISHYVAAITLFPLREVASSHEIPLKWFLLAFALVAILDVLQTGVRGDLFDPWYYMPFVLHFSVLCGVGFLINTDRTHVALSWWFFLVTLAWALIVRTYLL